MVRIKAPVLLLALCLLLSAALVQAQDAAECEAGFHLVEHAMGQTCVSERPQRVVVLDTYELDAALSLGVKPVGAVEAIAGAGFPAYLARLTEGIEVVGTISAPNLEAILALSPDLILSSTGRHEEIYPQLSEIAPTVFTEALARTHWKEYLSIYAQALNREDVLANRLAEYEARIDTIRSVLPVEEIEISVVRFVAAENRMMPRGSFMGTVLNDIGFARPEPQQSDEFKIVVSQEQINLLDGDVIFVSVYGDPADTEYAAFTESPLWATLGAVQSGHAYVVDDDHWFLGIGLLGANRIMDDLLILLSGDFQRQA